MHGFLSYCYVLYFNPIHENVLLENSFLKMYDVD